VTGKVSRGRNHAVTFPSHKRDIIPSYLDVAGEGLRMIAALAFAIVLAVFLALPALSRTSD
jgi:hypothetical protein